MPISPTTRRIPPEEWAGRKRQILELYLDRRLKLEGSGGVIETMAKDGFAATISQYESQLRVWKVRKNMKKDEWAKFFQEREQGRDTTPGGISGGVISYSRLERARRRYAPRRLQEGESAVSETSKHAAEETTAIPENGNMLTSSVVSPLPMPITEHNHRTTNTANHANMDELDVDLDIPTLGPTNQAIATPIYGLPGLFDFDQGMTDQAILENAWPQESAEDSLVSSLFPSSSSGFFAEIPNGGFALGHITSAAGAQYSSVPPTQLANPLLDPVAERIPNSCSPLVMSPRLYNAAREVLLRTQLARRLPSAMIAEIVAEGVLARVNTMASNSLWELGCDIQHSLTRAGNSNSLAVFSPGLNQLLSTETFVGEKQDQFGKMPIDVANEIRLHTRVAVSLLNGGPGLEVIPAAAALRFLNRCQGTQLSLIQCLGSKPSPAVRSLAERIFQAAIEDDNVVVVRYLLDHTGFFHANESICYYRGTRYTPLEKAARMQSINVARFLVDKVDVNETLARSYLGDILDLLVATHTFKKSTLNDDFLGLADALLDAKAIISAKCIASVLKGFTDTRLALRLIQKLASQTPLELISHSSLLIDVIVYLSKQDAMSMIELIRGKCRESGDCQCFCQFNPPISSVLALALEKGYEELVSVLIPYVASWEEVLQRPRIFENQAFIDSIFQEDPSLVKGPVGFNALLAALKSRDQDRLHSLEEKGVLNPSLHLIYLTEALTVALRVGNLDYATKILNLITDSISAGNILDWDLGASLEAALAHGFDDIAQEILPMAMTKRSLPQVSHPLYSAMKKRRPNFVRDIIKAGVHPKILCTSYDEGPSILEMAIEWGDDSILRQLCGARSAKMDIPCSLFMVVLQAGRTDLFWELVDANIEDKSGTAVQAAIALENLPLLDELIARGAKFTSNDTLTYTIFEHPSMMRPLLERWEKCSCIRRPTDIEDVLHALMRGYPETSEFLNLFFEFKLITEYIQQEDRAGQTLLGMAIETSAYNEPACISLIERLLHAGSDVNRIFMVSMVYDSRTTTILLEAIDCGLSDVVQLLLRHGAKTNEPALYGIKRTPLQKAAEANSLEIVSILLDAGAEVNAAPAMFEGATALQFAAIRGNCEMAMKLIGHGARLDVPPPRGPLGRWPLEGAAENGRLDMIQLLWEANEGPFDDRQCQKAKRLAERNGYLGCRDLIDELMAKPPFG